MIIPYLDAIDTVCMNCIEDTLNNEEICETCPVRKSADVFRASNSELKTYKMTLRITDDNKGQYTSTIYGHTAEEAKAEFIHQFVQNLMDISGYEAFKFEEIMYDLVEVIELKE